MTHQPAGITRWERSTNQDVNDDLAAGHRHKQNSSRPGSLHPQQDHLAAGGESPLAQKQHHHHSQSHKHKHSHLDDHEKQHHNQTSYDGHSSGHHFQHQSKHLAANTGADNVGKKQAQAQKVTGAGDQHKRPYKFRQQHKKAAKEVDEEEETTVDSDALDSTIEYDNVQYN
ncbi:hypothetical protein BGZ83_001417 [Gryganskiella cystojenkinii]|nr:hypothetical protein BGZ83_001417 [Gryganskiella cystojenkinii]